MYAPIDSSGTLSFSNGTPNIRLTIYGIVERLSEQLELQFLQQESTKAKLLWNLPLIGYTL